MSWERNTGIVLKIFIVTICSFLLLPTINTHSAPEVSTVPDKEYPLVGETVVVSVNVDLTSVPDYLGAYSFTVTWDPTVLDYVEIQGGITAEYSSFAAVDTTNVDSGIIQFNQFNSTGSPDLTNVARLVFTAVGNVDDTTSIVPSVSTLIAADTFADLTPGLIINSGEVTVSVLVYTLTMAATPGGDTTPNIGPHQYNDETVVPIDATPAGGYRFVNWTGGSVADPNSASTTVTMDGDKTVTANFQRVYSLTISSFPFDGGTTTGADIYDEGTVVPISATPLEGYRFVNWSGGSVADPNSTNTTVTMNSDMAITANFQRVYTLSIFTNPGSGGTTNPSVGYHEYDEGTDVVLTATEAAEYQFDSWSGSITSTTNPVTITMDQDKSINANFIQVPETVTPPTSISGSTSTYTDKPEFYTAVGASSNLGHTLEYRYDWGDGTFSGWGGASRNHSWSAVGTYGIKIQVRCVVHTEVISDWSDSLSVDVQLNGIWGDIDDDYEVNVFDALLIATYELDHDNPGLAPFVPAILQRADVDANTYINIADALICASYQANPNNVNLPPRVGNTLGEVAKIAYNFNERLYNSVTPIILAGSAEDNIYTVSTSLATSEKTIRIGAASIKITWDSNRYRYIGIENEPENSIINDNLTDNGELYLAQLDVDGNSVFVFPEMLLMPSGTYGADQVEVEILNAFDAGTFQEFSYENGGSAIAAIGETTPSFFELRQNIPNPFNPSTAIQYSVAKSSRTSLVIYNIQGQKVKTLVNRFEEPGEYVVTWDATDENGQSVGSGMYIYQLSTPEFREQKLMLLIR